MEGGVKYGTRSRETKREGEGKRKGRNGKMERKVWMR